MRKITVFVGLAMVLACMLSGCAQRTEGTVEPVLDEDFTPVVSVTGEVRPAVWAVLSAQTGGTVLEVLVEPGSEVTAGDLLLRLDSTDARLAALQAEASLDAAEAQLELLKAGPRSAEMTAAEAQVEAAQAAVAQASAQLAQLTSGSTAAEIAAARAQVAAAEAEFLAAREVHDETMKCYDVPGAGEVCPALGTLEEQARYAMHAAEEALTAAQAQLDALLEGSEDQVAAAEAAVWAAAAQRDIAAAQLELLQAGATAEDLAVAQAAVTQAEAAVEVARVTLDRCQIQAPFAGTVGAVDVRVGELVVFGQSLATLGDLDTLWIETTDLDEIDVARVEVGQPVYVSFDARPEQVFDGQVSRISPMAEPGAGGVNYTMIVELDQIDPAIRWGMTAFVDVEITE